MLLFQFKRDFPKIATGKPSPLQSQKLVPAKRKNCLIRKNKLSQMFSATRYPVRHFQLKNKIHKCVTF